VTRLLLIVVLALALTPAGAQARTVLGYQSDTQLCTDTTHTLDEMAGPANGHWLRLMVQPDRPDLQDCYLRAVQEAHARRLGVFVTLMRWRGLSGAEKPGVTSQEWATVAAHYARLLGPWVDAWSPLNEPNHRAFVPAVQKLCKTQTVTTSTAKLVKVIRFKRARHGKYRRSHHRYVRADRRFHGRRYRRVAFWKSNLVSVTGAYHHCQAEAAGAAYRRVFDAAVPQIRRYDPSAKIVVGDLAPTTDRAFMNAFYAQNRAPVRADALGLHYADATWKPWYDFARAHGLAVWATEWATRPGSGKPQNGLTAGLTQMSALGAQVTIFYELYGRPGAYWNTGLLHAGDIAQPGWDEAQKWNR
jgi:hypothetical protein